MKDNLRSFIEQHRAELDCFDPSPALWSSIALAVKAGKLSWITSSKFKTMTKFAFGASTVAAITLVAIQLNNGNRLYSSRKPLKLVPMEQLDQHKPDTLTKNTVETAVIPSATTTRSKQPDSPQVNAKVPVGVLPEPPVPPSDPLPPVPVTLQQAAAPTVQIPFDSTSTTKLAIDTFFNGIKRVEVDAQMFDIKLSGHQDERTLVRGELHSLHQNYWKIGKLTIATTDYKLVMEKQKDVLKIWVERDKEGTDRSCEHNDDSKRSWLELKLPDNTEVDITNSMGNISAENLKGSNVRLKSKFGHVKAKNLSSDVTLHASSGHITATGVKGNLRAESSFGHVNVKDIEGNVWLKSSSGNIHLEAVNGNMDVNTAFGHQLFEKVNGNIVSESSSGGLTVKGHKGNVRGRSSFGSHKYISVEGDITARVSSGNISMEDCAGNLVLDTRFGNITGKKIKLNKDSEFSTSSGNINMELANELQELSFDLSSSSGNLTVNKGNTQSQSDHSLKLGSGAIHIKGRSSFGNQNYR